MAAKVVWYRKAWWVRTHHRRKKKDRRIGPSKADKRQADEIARKINAAIALGTFAISEPDERPLPCRAQLERWHATYAPTFKPSFEQESQRTIENHLVPFFGAKDLREIREDDLLAYIRAKLEAGLAPLTIQTHLSILRRVFSLAVREGLVDRNPAARLGELMRRVGRRAAAEAPSVDSWTREEVASLLAVARESEPRFHAALVFLFSTGVRRGELLGLKWADVDFERRRIHVRRAWVRGEVTSPKSGRGRFLAMPPGLGSLLIDLLAERRREGLQRGWPDVPEWVFPAKTGGPLDARNFERAWLRVRRRAAKRSVRPLKLHCTRHTWASLALASGKSVRWVADQLGHASPTLTLKTYAHALREEEIDLGFADFGAEGVAGRLYTSPTTGSDADNENAPDATRRGRFGILEHETGFEPATPTLATWRSTS